MYYDMLYKLMLLLNDVAAAEEINRF